MTDIETPVETWTADQYAAARNALEKLRAALETAQTARVAAEYELDQMGRGGALWDVRIDLAEAIATVSCEAREIADAIARHEEDVG